MQHILDNIRASLITHPRSIRILYNNPKHRAILDRQDWLAPEGEIEDSLVCVWHNRPAVLSYPCNGTEGSASQYEADAACSHSL
jgi:hypothetical protein